MCTGKQGEARWERKEGEVRKIESGGSRKRGKGKRKAKERGMSGKKAAMKVKDKRNVGRNIKRRNETVEIIRNIWDIKGKKRYDDI